MMALQSFFERPFSERWRGLRIPLGAVSAALLVGLLLLAIGSDRISRPLFDLWQRAAPQDFSQTPVRIVWIDDASIASIGPWPWPRYVMARLTETIARAKPRVIGFDILFPEADRNSPESFASLYPELPRQTAQAIRALQPMDAVFGDVIARSPVVLARAGIDAPPPKDPPPLAIEAQFSAALPSGVASWGQALTNIAQLDDVALGHGLINGEADSDGVIRRVPLVARAGRVAMPGFALELVRVAQNASTVKVGVVRGELRSIALSANRLPVSADGTAHIPMGAWPAAATVSAADLLDGTRAPETLRDKIIIIGLSGAGTADVITTPLGSAVYGSVVQASAVDAILRQSLRVRPVWAVWVETIVAALLVGLVLLMGARFRGRSALLLAFAIPVVVLCLSALAFIRFVLLIDAAGPLLVGTAAMVMLTLLQFARARRNLFEQRLLSAQAAGELSAAREIQLGMLPQRATLAAFDVSVDVDALIEPARSIGGDFYDAIRIDAHRVCFLIGDVTGKGVPAALFMALSKALTKSVLLRDASDLGAAVTRLNDEIARDNSEDMFVTMLFGLLDTRSGQLSLCNAGHENPYRINTTGAVSLIAIDGGPPLAVMPGFVYEAEEIKLAYGESIVIVSDGITEAQSPSGDFFGHDRMIAVLTDWQANSALSGASNALLNEVRAFEGGEEATDDLTVLLFRYMGHAEKSGVISQ